ncbi:MAG: recombinase family protein [Candidatus Zixiibacteriota bacterium]
METMKCVIYARVSSKEQEKEGYSIPSQLKLLRNYAKEHGLQISSEYVDIETAKKTGRIGFNKMLSHLKTNSSCSIVLVEKTDRLYRNIKDWVTLDEVDIEIHFVKEGTILSKDSKSSDKFMHGIKVLMAKNYIDNLSEEVKKGLTEKAEQGEWPARPPIGYRRNTDSKIIEPDPIKGPFIKKLFEWYASGQYSLEQLSAKTKESGLFSRNSMAINKAGIHRILNNTIYYGEFTWKGKRFIGKHTPIISKSLYDEVQEVFAHANHPKETKHEFAFTGLLTCGKCGCSMTPEIKKDRYIYYHCTQYRGKCDNVYIREEKLGDLLADVVGRVRIGEEATEDIKKALLESQKDKREFHAGSIASLQKRQGHVQRLLDRSYEDKLGGKISEAMWERKSSEWDSELIDIQHKIRAHETANTNYYKTGVAILELANDAYDMYLQENREEQRKLLNTLLSNCTFYCGTLCPTYKKPFDILAKGFISKSKRG